MTIYIVVDKTFKNKYNKPVVIKNLYISTPSIIIILGISLERTFT